MHQILNLILKYRHFVLFAVLMIISLGFTIQSHSYQRSKFVNSANFLAGGVYANLDKATSYINLKGFNNELIDENVRLRERLFNLKDSVAHPEDSLLGDHVYRFIKARVINNNYALKDNFLTLRGGSQDSIKPDLGVITSNGIVGIVDRTSRRFSTVVSILNSNAQINAKLKKSGHFGILIWDGKDPELVKLVDVQEKAPVALGDTIVTGGMSTIFPEGIGIGTIAQFSLDDSGNYYTIYVKLFNDMTNLGHVYVIENLDKPEIKTLEQKTIDEQ